MLWPAVRRTWRSTARRTGCAASPAASWGTSARASRTPRGRAAARARPTPTTAAGTPVGGWSKRRDMYAASVAAFRSAHAVSDAEVTPQPTRQPASGAAAAKRGALCVDEEVEPQQPKRPRVVAQGEAGRATRSTSWRRRPTASSTSSSSSNGDARTERRAATTAAAPLLDPRMQNTRVCAPAGAAELRGRRAQRARRRSTSTRSRRAHPRQRVCAQRSARWPRSRLQAKAGGDGQDASRRARQSAASRARCATCSRS